MHVRYEDLFQGWSAAVDGDNRLAQPQSLHVRFLQPPHDKLPLPGSAPFAEDLARHTRRTDRPVGDDDRQLVHASLEFVECLDKQHAPPSHDRDDVRDPFYLTDLMAGEEDCLTAGGPIKTVLGNVNAYIAKAPDFKLNYTAGKYSLIFSVASQAVNATLLINLPDGTPKWRLDLATDPAVKAPGMVYGGPVVHGGKIYVATCNIEGDHARQPTAVVCIGQ